MDGGARWRWGWGGGGVRLRRGRDIGLRVGDGRVSSGLMSLVVPSIIRDSSQSLTLLLMSDHHGIRIVNLPFAERVLDCSCIWIILLNTGR